MKTDIRERYADHDTRRHTGTVVLNDLLMPLARSCWSYAQLHMCPRGRSPPQTEKSRYPPA